MDNRNWQKDWELCQKATPGPWLESELGEMGMLIWDAKFTAAAREALPYWLKRVQELEAQVEWCKWAEECPKSKHGLLQRVQMLESQVAVLREALEHCKEAFDWTYFQEELEAINKALSTTAGQSFLERVEKLEAVAKAARKFFYNNQYGDADIELEKALAALE